MVKLKDIEDARARFGRAIYHSPCPLSLTLSRLCGCQTYFKLENLQMTGSFKERGALNKLLQLSEAEKKAASSLPARESRPGRGLSRDAAES